MSRDAALESPPEHAAAIALSATQRRALFAVWLTYGTFYFCRVNFGPARRAIEHDLALTPLEMGFVLGAIKLGYAIGQLINGQLTERVGAKRVLTIGMFGSITMTLLFASSKFIVSTHVAQWALPAISHGMTRALSLLASSIAIGSTAALLIGLTFANGYFQAGGWPPTVKIMANWFAPAQRGRLMGIIGTSYQLGSALTIVIAGWLIGTFGTWRAAFVIPAAMLFASSIHMLLRVRERPADILESTTTIPRVASATPRNVFWLTVSNPKIWILSLGLFGLDIVRYGFLDWAPGHLQEAHASGSAAAAMKIAVLPFAGALGALVSGWLSDRFFQSRRAPVIASMLLCVGLLTLVYQHVISLGWVPTVTCLAGIGFFLYGAQILLVGTAAQDFARNGTAAAAAGFVDFTGSIGSFSGDVGTGYLLKNYGWSAATMFWSIAAIAGSMVVATLWKSRPAS